MNRRFWFLTVVVWALSGWVPAALGQGASSAAAGGDPERLSYAWVAEGPLGRRVESTIDTAMYNYFRRYVASQQSLAFASTGNLGGEGLDMILMDRAERGAFFFRDALRWWLPESGRHKFYNTRVPMTLLSYNTSGSHETGQDWLQAVFSGNVNRRLQIGARADYLYSQGSYANQGVKSFVWGFSGSYSGDRYDMQAFYDHYGFTNRENGGITDDLYITDPAVLQGGTASINPKSIPTRLSGAFNRLDGEEFYLNQRYKLGFRERAGTDTLSVEGVDGEVRDSLVERWSFVPVTSFVWTLDYVRDKHVFDNTNVTQGRNFWENTYLSLNGTHDVTRYWSLSNTFGVQLLEGFNRWAKAGLSAWVTHEIRRYHQTPDSVAMGGAERPEGLTAYPLGEKLAYGTTENLLYVGGRLSKERGRLLRYDVSGRVGLVGAAAGDVRVSGEVSTLFRLRGDSVRVTGYGELSNEAVPFLLKEYVSNHFIWKNDFGKTRRVRFGGYLNVPLTGTYVNVGVENVQNLIYFDEGGLPVQNGGSVQVVSASLHQDFRWGILNWRNRLTYQTTSDDVVLPAPKLALYTNLFLLFKVARVLDVQFGVDCDYYTRYYAPNYQPATMSFTNQREVKVGNYPFMNVYANMKLSKARFYVMFSHVNQGLTGNNYFALPHYPMNPRRFQIGISVDFAN